MEHNRIRKRNGVHLEPRVLEGVTPPPVATAHDRKLALLLAGAVVLDDPTALVELRHQAPHGTVTIEAALEAVANVRRACPLIRSEASQSALRREINDYLRSEAIVSRGVFDD